VPPRVATRYNVVPLHFRDEVLTLASDRVHDVREEDHLRALLERPIEWSLCRRREVAESIKHYYGVGIQTFVESGMGEARGGTTPSEGARGTGEESRHVAGFVRHVIADAVRNDATDIHIEPYENKLRLRYRVDGVLQPVSLPRGVERYQRAVVSSIKIMAQLNIAERRLPQDGAFSLDVDEASYDIRVSILPSRHGETVNLRILNRRAEFLDLGQLGLPRRELNVVQDIIAQPHGVVLFTGATGSGKTTSLYAALAWLNQAERKIITIEDPIEYQIQGISQLQVNPVIGFTFASGLRSVLRHDPDVVLIGEIRDAETASIAVSASLTGHLVFSTLHTNDSAGALPRLIDMGVEPYLVASSVLAIIAQRLVRRVCKACREPHAIDPLVLERIRAEGEPDEATFVHGRGCPDCRFTGYNGRRALFEILVMNDELRSLVVEHAPSTRIMQLAVSQGLTTLRRYGWTLAREGITTVEEVLRVTRRL
ncbi:MAG: type II/IV secretion system protein, partial [Lentisphaerae bacterium]|nr:type II/IV secretion system protein [Lentisphaerota bacterium]